MKMMRHAVSTGQIRMGVRHDPIPVLMAMGKGTNTDVIP